MTSTTPSPISDQAAGEPVAWMVTNTIYGSVSLHLEEREARAYDGLRQYTVEPLGVLSTAPTTGSAPESLAFEYAKAEVARKLWMRADAVRVCPISDIECASTRECELASGKCRKFAAPASPAASVPHADTLLRVAVEHGLDVGTVESIAKDLLAASMGGDKS